MEETAPRGKSLVDPQQQATDQGLGTESIGYAQAEYGSEYGRGEKIESWGFVAVLVGAIFMSFGIVAIWKGRQIKREALRNLGLEGNPHGKR